MRRLIVAEFLTLDGVMEAPGLEEHRDGKNAWALRFQTPELAGFIRDQFGSLGGFLLGRRTWQIWAAFWPTAGGDQDLVKEMNDLPKYVVSSTLKEADWSNSTILRGDWAEQVAELKRQPGKDILVEGSADLVAGLMEHDLVDEYQLLLFPVILGSGKHLFPDGVDLRPLHLVETRAFGSGVVLLVYRPESEMPTSEYVEAYSWSAEQVRSRHAAENTDRVLATVLFTDIVDSTARAAELGDRQWRQLLERHDRVSRVEVARWHGKLVKTTGDGFLATFDAPTRALRCAFGLEEAIAPLGLVIRAAIHTGEVEMREGDVGGIGVHIASRALAEAGGHEIIVTRTVRDLATGTDLDFRPRGSVGLRGVPGEWELFEASTRPASP
jgi:class 3 adenylate cyclase/dihydrofolate reductase